MSRRVECHDCGRVYMKSMKDPSICLEDAVAAFEEHQATCSRVVMYEYGVEVIDGGKEYADSIYEVWGYRGGYRYYGATRSLLSALEWVQEIEPHNLVAYIQRGG